MLDFDKMTVAEHEAYKEMQRKAEAFDEIAQIYDENTGLGELGEDFCNIDTLLDETKTVISEVESGDRP